jgi:hypothetical protein
MPMPSTPVSSRLCRQRPAIRGTRFGYLLAVAASAATAAAALGIAPSSARAASLITSFTAGVLVDENTSNPQESDYATQAGSHPDIAFTKFTLNTGLGSTETVRVDLPPGLSVNSNAIPRCNAAGTALNTCPSDTRVGTATVTIAKIPIVGSETLTGAVYNMVAPKGAPGDYAFQVAVMGLITIRTDLIGGVRYYSSNGQPADYGEYFTINEISNLLGAALEKSELKFWGAPEEHNGGGAPDNAFLTNPTACSGPQTTHMSAATYAPTVTGTASSATPVGAGGCASVPFAPTVSVTPSTTQHDKPDGIALDIHVPQDQNPAHLGAAHLQQATVTLPAGMSLDPSAANGLQTCSDAQFAAATNKAIACPAASIVGSAEITTPVLSAPLTGAIYVGAQQEGNPYRVFLDAENASSGVAVRLTGSVRADPLTGQLTATFAANPQLPFTDLKLAFNAGPGALFANPLACGTATSSASLLPFTGAAAVNTSSSFTVDANGAGGACAGPPGFAAGAAGSLSSSMAGGATALALHVTRVDGEQTLGGVTAALPQGLLANISSVALCGEPAGAQGGCGEASRIGTVAVTAGSGSSPLALSGSAYLTGGHGGAPFGLSIVVPAIAGPYNLGNVIVRATVALDTVHGQLTIATDPLPTIVGGIPLRLRALTVDIDREGLLEDPTSCAPSVIAGTVTSTALQSQPFSSPTQMTGCGSLAFAPTLAVTPSSTQRDSSTGLEVTLGLPGGSADLSSAVVKLPAGLSLNPAFAAGLEACSDAQFGQGGQSPVTCPSASAIGTVEVRTPLLPTPLSGSVYVGQPLSGEPESGQEYRVFLDAENATYGLSVRLVGSLAANAQTGQLTATFAGVPPIPFSSLRLDLTGNTGASSPLSNSPECGQASLLGTLTATTGATATPSSSFTVDANGAGGACTSAPPFEVGQSIQDQPADAAADSAFTLSLTRADGQQYLSGVRTTLPAGLVGMIAAVTQCPEPQAGAGSCPPTSRIGSATVASGTGPSPLQLTGAVFLTGPYQGAPFGLAIVVPAVAGPYDLGTVVVRARIDIDEHTARVSVTTGALPTILGGVPLRLSALSVDLDRAGFMRNPTSCTPQAAESLLSSTTGTMQAIATPFQSLGCGQLPFEVSLAASASRHTKQNGAGLDVELSIPHQHEANLAAVTVTLPAQLPARLSTLQSACAEAVFLADPSRCAPASVVGHASVITPVLPDPLAGSAYLVANGGAAVPNLDLVLSGDGVRLMLQSHTDLKNGVITSSFAALPDVPMSRFSLVLPEGPGSVLSANGVLCGEAMAIASTITAQDGKQLSQATPVTATGCSAAAGGRANAALANLRIAPRRFLAAPRGASIAPPPSARGRHRRVKRTGATVSYTDVQPGSVTFTVLRAARGEARGRRCVVPARRRGRRKRSCVRYIRVGAFSRRGVAGANRFHFSGRVAARKLAPGAYRLSATSAASAGVPTMTASVPFFIKRG